MTGREFLSGRGRLARTISLSASLILIGLIPVLIRFGATGPLAGYFTLMLMGCVALPVMAKQWALSLVRCPWCRGGLGRLIDFRFRLAPSRFCFHCAHPLDDDVTNQGKPKDALLWDRELA